MSNYPDNFDLKAFTRFMGTDQTADELIAEKKRLEKEMSRINDILDEEFEKLSKSDVTALENAYSQLDSESMDINEKLRTLNDK